MVALTAAGAAAAVAVSLLTAAATASAGVTAQSFVGAAVAAAHGWQTTLAAFLSVLLLLAHQALGLLRKRFIFMDYVHAAVP